MIEVERLVKDYGTVVAVRDLSFRVGKGEICGFLGPNGAGKSTTLRILAGFLGPTAGVVRIAGHDVVEDGLRARRCLGYMPEAAPLYPELRVREYLTFRAELKGVARGARRAAVGSAMEATRIADMGETLIGHLSKGYRQRVGLADALVASPPLLILDEPTAGLDPNQIREVRDLVKRLGEAHTILVSTHILPEVESMCTRALVIDRGRLVAEGTVDELRARRGAMGARLELGAGAARARGIAAAAPGVVVAGEEDPANPTTLTVEFSARGDDAGEALERLVAALVGAGVGVRAATPLRASLEDVFVELTRHAGPLAPPARPADAAAEGRA